MPCSKALDASPSMHKSPLLFSLHPGAANHALKIAIMLVYVIMISAYACAWQDGRDLAVPFLSSVLVQIDSEIEVILLGL